MLTRALALITAVLLVLVGAPAQAVSSASSPLDDAFYRYDGRAPLSSLAPGTVLKKRVVDYSIQGLALPLKATQILYRTEDATGRAVVNATTVVKPLAPATSTPRVISYQSFYDSLNPADQPSAAIAGGSGLGNGIVNAETGLIAPLLLSGYTVNIPDTEGQRADFAAGPEYGVTTLDSLRAISKESSLGVGSARIGLLGYSGGAIASEWAAELAPSYAPGIAKRIVGTAIGGVLVQPSRNLTYVEGSRVWSGVIPMALVGLARAYKVDLTPYANPYGKKVMKEVAKASIGDALGRYPGLTWKQITKPQYSTPESVPAFVKIANRLIMGTGGTPSAPLFIGQGTRGELEGTPTGGAGIGEGDGVMVAGDVRSLARQYCGQGVKVQYREYPLSHVGAAATWMPEAIPWLQARFDGTTAPENCSTIAPGNPLTPIKVAR